MNWLKAFGIAAVANAMVISSVFGVAAVIDSTGGKPIPPLTDTQLKQAQMLNATVRVERPEGRGTGSGTVLRSDRTGTFILTNHHVAGDKGSKLLVRFWHLNTKGETVLTVLRDAEVVAADKDKDLALLKLADSEFRAEAVARVAPEDRQLMPGDFVWTLGAPLGFRVSATTGLLGVLNQEIPTLGGRIMHSAPTIFGNSGGGVWQKAPDGGYEYIATTQAIAMAGMGSPVTTTAFAIPNSMLRAFLKENEFAWVLA
jgi:S1-C subfamily serine protease